MKVKNIELFSSSKETRDATERWFKETFISRKEHEKEIKELEKKYEILKNSDSMLGSLTFMEEVAKENNDKFSQKEREIERLKGRVEKFVKLSFDQSFEIDDMQLEIERFEEVIGFIWLKQHGFVPSNIGKIIKDTLKEIKEIISHKKITPKGYHDVDEFYRD